MNRPDQQNFEAARGFSLMELMVVIAILGILVTLVATNVMPMLEKAKVTGTQSDITTWKSAITQYQINNGKIPDTLEILTQPDPKNGDDFYLDKEPIDQWGTPFEYRKLGNNKYEIVSFGSDMLPGGDNFAADISSIKLANAKPGN